jgi:hypothetical protein
VTRRAWIVLALGLVAAVMTGGAFARAGRSDFRPSPPQPGWGMFTPAAWKTVSSRIERRGFAAASIQLVGGTDTSDGRPFGLVAGRSRTGATCVTPVRGTTVGATVCRLTKPFVVFTAPQTWKDAAVPGVPAHVVHATAVLGIARHDVTGIVVRDSQHRGATGMSLIQTGRLTTFAGGFVDLASLRAFDAKNHTLARLVLRRP